MKTPEVNQYRYFVAIADTGSMKQAAEILGITQSALIQYKHKLESELGYPCFLLSSGGTLTLTPPGVRYYQYCCDALQLWQTLQSQLDTIRAEASAGEDPTETDP